MLYRHLCLTEFLTMVFYFFYIAFNFIINLAKSRISYKFFLLILESFYVKLCFVWHYLYILPKKKKGGIDMTTWHHPMWKSRDGSQIIFRTKKRLTCRYCGRSTRYLIVFGSGDSIPLCRDCLYAHIVNNKRALRLARKGIKTMKEKNSKKNL